jgi:IclR family negative regulator of allantoin and glyoxylate utilization operon
MRRLMLLSGETVNVAIRNGTEAVLIGQKECKSMVRMCAPLGSRMPLHASGAGKALLYPLMEEELMDIVVKTGLQRLRRTRWWIFLPCCAIWNWRVTMAISSITKSMLLV